MASSSSNGNLVDDFEESFQACIHALTKHDAGGTGAGLTDKDEINLDVDQTTNKFVDLARQMESFFIQKRFLLSAMKPELVLKEENFDLRYEMTRKDDLIRRHYEKIDHWKAILSDVQQQNGGGMGGGGGGIGGGVGGAGQQGQAGGGGMGGGPGGGSGGAGGMGGGAAGMGPGGAGHPGQMPMSVNGGGSGGGGGGGGGGPHGMGGMPGGPGGHGGGGMGGVGPMGGGQMMGGGNNPHMGGMHGGGGGGHGGMGGMGGGGPMGGGGGAMGHNPMAMGGVNGGGMSNAMGVSGFHIQMGTLNHFLMPSRPFNSTRRIPYISSSITCSSSNSRCSSSRCTCSSSRCSSSRVNSRCTICRRAALAASAERWAHAASAPARCPMCLGLAARRRMRCRVRLPTWRRRPAI